MSVIPREQILRLNCPGFGEEGYLTLGKARPLDSYSVIVANPVSILHLFDRDLESVKDIDTRLAEGAGSFTLPSDSILQDIEGDLKQRIFELVSFLEKGGLLVYYLCRPFMVQGPASAMDNYYWLESLAPDSPAELNVRHMSSVSHGRIVEPTDQAEKSEFSAYFRQPGLEWNTIIRSDFLTEGYIVLATAGPRKCIAAHLIAGDNGGRILFLPAPYSPDFDRTLMDCINIWNQGKQTGHAMGMPGAQSAAASPPPPYMSMATPPPTMFAGLDGTPYYSNVSPNEPAHVAASAVSAMADAAPMPPVPKFNPNPPSAAPQPAQSILDAVNANAATAEPIAPRGFDARTTADLPGSQDGENRQTFDPGSSGIYGDDFPKAGVFETQELRLDQMPNLTIVSSQNGANSNKNADKPRNLLREMETMAAEQTAAAKAKADADEFANENSAKSESFDPAPASEQSFASVEPETAIEDAAVERAEEPEEDHSHSEPHVEMMTQPAKYEEESVAPANGSGNSDSKLQSNGEAIPEAKDLIKKMEEMTKTVTPEWCATFSFPDLDDLRKERESLAETIRQTQTRITQIDGKLATLDGLKNALLAADGEELKNACSRVFKRLGWTPAQSEVEQKELLLIGQEHADVIARVVRSTGAAPRPDIAQLAQSVLTYWGDTEVEPKGLLIASTFVNTAPADREEDDFTDALADFAQKKSLCLMTTVQLLCMYRDVELGKLEPDQVRNRILDTNGRLAGFELEPLKTKV